MQDYSFLLVNSIYCAGSRSPRVPISTASRQFCVTCDCVWSWDLLRLSCQAQFVFFHVHNSNMCAISRRVASLRQNELARLISRRKKIYPNGRPMSWIPTGKSLSSTITFPPRTTIAFYTNQQLEHRKIPMARNISAYRQATQINVYSHHITREHGQWIFRLYGQENTVLFCFRTIKHLQTFSLARYAGVGAAGVNRASYVLSFVVRSTSTILRT